MRYTVWLHGSQIGETKFEFRRGQRERAGAFQPTEFGLTVLPGITAMGPALFEFGDMCRRVGLNTGDPSPEQASLALETFGSTPEGQRVLAAARQVARVEVHDPSGRALKWESLAITDLDWLLREARVRQPSAAARIEALPHHDLVRFMISLTLKDTRKPARFTWFEQPYLSS
jgi:hypothetical protein